MVQAALMRGRQFNCRRFTGTPWANYRKQSRELQLYMVGFVALLMVVGCQTCFCGPIKTELDQSRVIMKGKHSPPPRQHRPYGSPFASSIAELTRRTMTSPGEQRDQEAAKHVVALDSNDVEQRRQAALGLWRMSKEASPATYEALVKAVTDDDWKVRWDAALAFGKLGLADRWNTDPYIARLAMKLKRNTTDPITKCKLAEALGRIGTPAQVYSRNIGDNLEHEDWRVRLACTEALGRLGPEQHLHRATLVRLKSYQVEDVRVAAERVLLKKPLEKPGWLKVQNPAWRQRVLKSVSRKNRGKR